MQWFKHDSNASADAKLRRVRMKYGLEGYGLYWYCLELIAQNVTANNLTFELEHDAELIAHDTGIHYERVQEMMVYMVNVGLFENDSGVITCLKMAKRLDQSMTSSESMRKMIAKIKENHDGVMMGHDGVMMNPDSVMQEEKRTDKNRKDKNRDKNTTCSMSTDKPVDAASYQAIVDGYNEILSPPLRQVVLLNDKRRSAMRARIRSGDAGFPTIDDWLAYFVYVETSDFLMGRATPARDGVPFKADFDWLISPTNCTKVIEGKYHEKRERFIADRSAVARVREACEIRARKREAQDSGGGSGTVVDQDGRNIRP